MNPDEKVTFAIRDLYVLLGHVDFCRECRERVDRATFHGEYVELCEWAGAFINDRIK